MGYAQTLRMRLSLTSVLLQAAAATKRDLSKVRSFTIVLTQAGRYATG